MLKIYDGEGPSCLTELLHRTVESGFDMPSDHKTGMLLQTLAASKPGGRFLEMGTGTGLATAWLLSGMTADASLVTVDNNESVQSIARQVLGEDTRVTFVQRDGVEFLQEELQRSYDLVFADAWPGKYEARTLALDLTKPGGFYIGDDMLPQPNWPEGHQPRVDDLLTELKDSPNWVVVAPAWGSGFVIAVRQR